MKSGRGYGSGNGNGYGFRLMTFWYVVMLVVMATALYCAFNGLSPVGIISDVVRMLVS